jgi:hypothetical protein
LAQGKKAAPTTPATPRKRGRKPAAATTATADGEKADDGVDDESPTKKTKTTPKAKPANGEKPAKAGMRPMPTSWENASEEDRMLLRMKDEENKPWAEIKEAWEKMTGEKVGGSTLSGRYGRIKANFVILSEGDVSFPVSDFDFSVR